MQKRILSSVVMLIILVLTSTSAFSATTPEQSFQACVAKLRGAKSIKAGFNGKMSGRRVSGTLLSKGQKFSLTASGTGTWYDGKNMWSYSSANGETTLWTPSKSELAESNPLLYLASATDYVVKPGSGAKSGEAVVVLTPKRRNSGVKSATVVINTSTNLPKSISISAGSGSYNITFNTITLNPSLSDTQFVYPKSKYPKVPITDLR